MTHLEKLDYIPQNIDLMAGMDITGNIKILREISNICSRLHQRFRDICFCYVSREHVQ